MKVYIIATLTDETSHGVLQYIFSTKELAKQWVLGRAYYWSTGCKEWEYIDDDKAILKLETNKNRRNEYCIWHIIEYELDNNIQLPLYNVLQEWLLEKEEQKS